MQEHLFEHINGEDHSDFLENIAITLLEKKDDIDSKKEKITEPYAIWKKVSDKSHVTRGFTSW